MSRRPAPPRRRRRGRLLAVTFGCLGLLVVLGVAGGVGAFYARTQLEAPSSTHGPAVSVQVEPGESVAAVAADLDAKGLIRSTFWFERFAGLKGLAGSLRSGRYMFDSGMGATAIIDRLRGAPDQATHRLVLAEGLTQGQMAAAIQGDGLGIKADDYLAEARSPAWTQPFLAGRPAGAPLEGFLFPDTYDVVDGSTAHAVVQLQLDAFGVKAAPLLQKAPAGRTAYEALVVASIVEREARFPEDRAHVASVLYNRLARGMPLQVDASVLYGLGVFGRSPNAQELQYDTPWNTYLHTGLPPTPIANPGVESIRAAVEPSTTTDLFYVSDDCGHNHYSATGAEHDRQVALYVGTKRC